MSENESWRGMGAHYKCIHNFGNLQYGVGGKLRRTLEIMYKNDKCSVRKRCEDKLWFDVKT